ncbi:hypothetical protein BDN72DRAFT_607116 [Pluteus cervinus]|uniref:Uncharacterized protein n=1 Tax=Pluteus cervinus TaxID=181527 RepID=A0ACD3B9Q0_9AGAR|nr:hypothetical protein BDN72DRAFT_607116 [Pluteus cervinus]
MGAETPQPDHESDDEIEFIGMTSVPSTNVGTVVKTEPKATSTSTLHSVEPDNAVAQTRARSLSSLTPFTGSTPGPSRLATEPLKIKKEAMLLPRSVVSNYLSGVGTFSISPDPVPTPVSRRFLRKTYGGSDQHFISFTPKSRDPGSSSSSHPKGRPIVFPEPELNPEIPREPGAPGLIFASRHEILEHPPWSVFRKVSGSASPVVWTYLGEYKNELCGKMTAAQFQQQRPEVKERWGGLVVKAKQCNAYVAMRARIGLRKAHPGKPISEKDVEKEMVKIKKGYNPISVSDKDVIKAFCDGDEGVDIIKMRCVGYDHKFVNHFAMTYKTWQKQQKQPQGSVGDAAPKSASGRQKGVLVDPYENEEDSRGSPLPRKV